MKKLLLFFFVSIFTTTTVCGIHDLATKVNGLYHIKSQLTFDREVTIKFTKYNVELELSEVLMGNLGLLKASAPKNDKELFGVSDALTKKVNDRDNPLSLLLLLHFYLDGTIPVIDKPDIGKFGFNSPIKLAKAVYNLGKDLEIIKSDNVWLDYALLKFLSELVDFTRIDESLTSDLKDFNSLSACKFIVDQRQKNIADEHTKILEDKKIFRAEFAKNNDEKANTTLKYVYGEEIRTQLRNAISKGENKISMPMNGQIAYELWRLVKEKNNDYKENDKLYISMKKEFSEEHECNAISGWNLCCLAWPLVFPLYFVDFDRFFNVDTWTLTISIAPIIDTHVDSDEEN